MGFGDILKGAGDILTGGLGKLLDVGVGYENRDKSYEMQERFAKSGIRWKVADAKAAGLHPLAALGATGASASPVTVGSDFGSMGQDIHRAMQATRTAEERKETNAVNAQLSSLAIERGRLENEWLRSRIARENSAQIGPAMPSPVESGFRIVPNDIPANAGPGHEHLTAGPATPGLTRVDMGPVLGTMNLLSKDATEQLEDMDLAKYAVLGANNAPWRIDLRSPQDVAKPSWVKDLEMKHGKTMRPFLKKGVVYWEFNPQSGAGRVGTYSR